MESWNYARIDFCKKFWKVLFLVFYFANPVVLAQHFGPEDLAHDYQKLRQDMEELIEKSMDEFFLDSVPGQLFSSEVMRIGQWKETEKERKFLIPKSKKDKSKIDIKIQGHQLQISIETESKQGESLIRQKNQQIIMIPLDVNPDLAKIEKTNEKIVISIPKKLNQPRSDRVPKMDNNNYQRLPLTPGPGDITL